MRFLCHGLILIYTSVLADVAPDNLDYSNFLADASDSLGSDVWTPDSDVYNPNLEIATPFEGTGAKPALDPTGDDTISDMFASEITGSDLDGNIADAGNGCSSQSKQSFGKLRAREICVNPNAKERITEDAISEEKRFCQVDQVPGCCLPSEMFQGLWWSFMQGPCQDCE